MLLSLHKNSKFSVFGLCLLLLLSFNFLQLTSCRDSVKESTDNTETENPDENPEEEEEEDEENQEEGGTAEEDLLAQDQNLGFVNGWIVDSHTEQRIEGASITSTVLLSETVESNEDGEFSLPVYPDNGLERFFLVITKDGYTTAYREIWGKNQRDVTQQSIRLTPLDSAVTTITSDGGTHTNSTGNVIIEFAQGAVSNDIDVRVTEFNLGPDLGGVLPTTSFFTYAVEFQPDGTEFNGDVTVRMRNTRGFSPNTQIPLGYFNSETREWEHKGFGVVDSTGQWLELNVDHFSSWDFNLAILLDDNAFAPNGVQDFTQDMFGVEDQDCGQSSVGLFTGSLTIERDLPTYKVLNQDFGLSFVYQSQTVDPKVLLSFEKNFDASFADEPEKFGFKAIFEGQVQETVFHGTSENMTLKALFEARNVRGYDLRTGLYSYQADFTNYYSGEYATTNCFGCLGGNSLGIQPTEQEDLVSTSVGKVSVVNNETSPFGAGWGLRGLKRLYFEPGGNGILLVDGSGLAVPFIAGEIERFAGSGDYFNLSGDNGLATEASLDEVVGLALDDQGNLYLADREHHVVRKIDSSGIITLVAGDGSNGYSGDGGQATSAKLDSPSGIAVSPSGEVYIADTDNHVIRKVDSNGIITTVAGNGSQGFASGSHVATNTELNTPVEVELDDSGNLYIVDSRNHAIRMLDSTGTLTTVVGTGSNGYSGDGGLAVSAQLYQPEDIAFDSQGNLYIADSRNSLIRKVSTSGIITTYAGTRNPGDLGENGLATAALLGEVKGLAFGPDDSLYLADYTFRKIKKISPDGILTTVAGSGGVYIENNLGASLLTPLSRVEGVVVDANHELYISDTLSHYIYKTSSSFYRTHGGLDSSLFIEEDEANPENTIYTLTNKDLSTEIFDADGYLISRSDKNGNTVYYNYQDSLLISIEDPLGNVTTLSYDGENKLQSVRDPQGRVTNFQIDADGNLTSLTYPEGTTWQFAYNDSHKLTQKTGPRGYSFIYNYNSFGNITSIESPTGEVRTYDSNWSDYLIEDMSGTLEDPADPLASEAPTTVFTDGMGLETTYTFDRRGKITSINDADNNSTTITRDSQSQVTQITDPLGEVKIFAYDVSGNLTESDVDDGTAASGLSNYAYNDLGLPIEIQPSYSSGTIEITYDSLGNILTIDDEGDAVTTYTYNRFGLVETVTNDLGETTTLAYNSQGNLQSITDDAGEVTSFSYQNGQVSSVTDANGGITSYEYDDLNRVTTVTNALGNTTEFQYEQMGCNCSGGYDRITQMIDANGNVTQFDYDEIGQLTQYTDPFGNTASYDYNHNRLLEFAVDRNGNEFYYTYNTLNQLENLTYAEDTLAYTYDAVGNVLSVSNSHQSLDATFQIWGDTGNYGPDVIRYSGILPDLEQDYNSSSRHFHYRYEIDDLFGENVIVKNDYGDIYILTYSEDDESMSHTFDDIGRITRVAFNLGTDLYVTYNNRGLAEELSYNFLSQPDQNHSYTFDALGNRLTETDYYGNHTYTYDAISQLISNSYTGESYTYDATGNRLTDAAGRTYTYGTNNQLERVNNTTYAYDNNGNLIEKVQNGITWTYTWNGLNELIEVTNTNGLNASFLYDAFGRRIQKDVNGTVRRYSYDGDDVRLVYDGNNTLLLSYNYGQGVDNLYRIVDHTTNTNYHVLKDARNSIYQIQYDVDYYTNTWEKNTYEYDSFGNITNQSGDLENTLTYTGREWEEELGLYYYRNRWYDPNIGRFISEDPLGFAGSGVNLYKYVGNNPVNFVDPYGLKLAYADPFALVKFEPMIKKIESTPVGKKLITQLRNSSTTYYLHAGTYVGAALSKSKACTVGNSVYVDPFYHPIIKTTKGKLPISTMRLLAHELGHLAGALDDGKDKMNNVRKWENPIMLPIEGYSRVSY